MSKLMLKLQTHAPNPSGMNYLPALLDDFSSSWVAFQGQLTAKCSLSEIDVPVKLTCNKDIS